MPDNRNRKRPIQVKFFVDESKLGLNSKIKKFSDSFICGKAILPLRGENSFLYTVCKRPFGLFFFCPYIANIVMPCKPLIFTLNAPLRAVKICPSSETSVCAPETSALVR